MPEPARNQPHGSEATGPGPTQEGGAAHPRACGGLKALLLAAALAAAGCSTAATGPQRDLAEMLLSRESAWNTPLRLTARAEGASEGDFHPGTGRLVFVSTQAGSANLWLHEDAPLGLAPPRVLAPHSARDRWPRLGPRGRRLAFASSREDPGGDIWLLKLKGGGRAGKLQKLTGAQTADDQPCWHPAGRKLFFASAPSLKDSYNLWELDLASGNRTKLTESGGQMPDCSPDGRHLLFASGDQGVVSLYVMRLSDGRVARLTEGTPVDAFPCWSRDGRRVYFTRYAVDTDRDGDVDLDDASSLWSVGFDERIFSQDGRPPARQLTTFAGRDFGPRPVEGGVLFTSHRAVGVGREGSAFNLWALPGCGEAPDFRRVGEFLQFARAQQGAPGVSPWSRLLAWQNVLWAARESAYSGRIELGLAGAEQAAQGWLRMADLLARLGLTAEAETSLHALLADPAADQYLTGLAGVRLLELERRKLESLPPDQAASRWAKHLDEARRLGRDCLARATAAERTGTKADAARLEEVCALAKLQRGLALHHVGRYEEALEVLDEVTKDYAQHTEAAARALLARAEVFKLLGQAETVRNAYLRVLRSYPTAEPYVSRAAELIVDGILRARGRDSTLERKFAELRALIEAHETEPVLAALAQNRIGDLYYGMKDYHRAREAYGGTISRYPQASRQAAVAHLALAAIETDQEDFAGALETYRRLQSRPESLEKAGDALARARKGYINTVLLKAHKELQAGDVKLAGSTYVGLIEFDPRLAAGHRGWVDCLARLGRIDEAIVHYRQPVERDPRDDVAHYALALAYSYYGPEDWAGGGRKAGRRVAIDRRALRLLGKAILVRYEVPYYHQLRGFLLSRIGVARGEVEAKRQALDAYGTALSLSDPQADRSNYPNLLFNVAEAYTLLGQGENAYDYYVRAMDAGLSLEGTRGEAAVENMADSALDYGRYDHAIQLLERLIEQLGGPLPDDGSARSARLIRRAKLLDRLALAHYLKQDYAAAARHYQRTIAAIEDLMAEPGRKRTAYTRNILRAQRNQAVNLYYAVEQRALDVEKLEEAYALLLDAVAEVERVGVVARDEEAPGLFVIDIEMGLGEERGLAQFNVGAEKRLLYTFLARISARAGDYAAAASFLRKKLALYPRLPAAAEDAGAWSEQAVVRSQLGQYLLHTGDRIGAAEAFRAAMSLDRGASNLKGEMYECFSLGRVALQVAGLPPEERHMSGEQFGEWMADVAALHRDVLSRARREPAAHLVRGQASLNANLAALLAAVDRSRVRVREAFEDAR